MAGKKKAASVSGGRFFSPQISMLASGMQAPQGNEANKSKVEHRGKASALDLKRLKAEIVSGALLLQPKEVVSLRAARGSPRSSAV